MPLWATVGIPYFIYVAVVAVVLPRLRARARVAAAGVAAVGVVLSYAAGQTESFWLRQLVLPPLALLAAYWGTGLLWVEPMERVERLLARTDRLLGVPRIVARMPRPLIALLEGAYAGVYPLIPLALFLYMTAASAPDGDRFWSVVLLTDFVCFGMLPWIQTRPPRAVEPLAPWTSRVRTLNLELLGALSIGVNTVPSGHAAEALVIALLLSGTPVWMAAVMWLCALAISAGAIFGRYHYALDVFAGWLVAVVVWLALA